jgi:hypothetical protein
MTTVPLPVIGAVTVAFPPLTAATPNCCAPAKNVTLPVGAVEALTESAALNVSVTPVVTVLTPWGNAMVTVGDGFGGGLS